MSGWPNIQGLALVLFLVFGVPFAVWCGIAFTAPEMPAERDGLLDNASNPLRDESEHSRAKYRSHR